MALRLEASAPPGPCCLDFGVAEPTRDPHGSAHLWPLPSSLTLCPSIVLSKLGSEPAALWGLSTKFM